MTSEVLDGIIYLVEKGDRMDTIIDERYENITEYENPPYKKRKKRLGDRSDGRRIRSLPSMNYVVPFIMKERSDASNHFEDVIDIHAIEEFLEEKHKAGFTDMTLLHVVLAAYVRVVSERPGVNRFISGQRIFARNSIQCCMDIKKEMTLAGEGTCIKVEFDPRDNVDNVYKKFQVVAKNALAQTTGFDKTAKWFKGLPRFFFRIAMKTLYALDYLGLIPKKLLDVSPFHGSMFITHLGSIGIPAIHHHLYNFGNVPVFIALGNMFTDEATLPNGEKEKHHYITLKVTTDERICDGYYFASAFRKIKRYLLNPSLLNQTLETVTEDID